MEINIMEHGMNSNLEHLETKYWVETIICHPELEDKCPWNMFGSAAWHDILMEHPEFIRHAPKKIRLSFMSLNQWLEVLNRHPKLDEYFPAMKTMLAKSSEAIGKLWGRLISHYPQFAKYSPWKHLRRDDWKRVLSQQPQFIGNYERERTQMPAWQFTLTPSDQAEVIACQPSLLSHFKTKDFTASNWETILLNQPQFHEKCNINKMAPYNLGRLLVRHPEWLDHCDTNSKHPDDILCIAENYPDILNHYDLEQFKEIGGGDTPWMEKYPCLVPYSRWNFSYSYWDELLTRLSSWLTTGKRERVNALAKIFARPLKQNVTLAGRRTHGSLARPLPHNPKENNLRNSLDSILDYRYWVGLGGPIDLMEVIPLRIRNILKDENLTYEQLMIKMSMFSEEECGMIFYGLFITDPNNFLDNMLGNDMTQTIRMVPSQVLLPLSILFASSNILYFVMLELSCENAKSIADFRDKAGNNALHYFFFRNPMYLPSRKTIQDKFEHDNFTFLLDQGCNPDMPNNMGFSYNQICNSMKTYLEGCDLVANK